MDKVTRAFLDVYSERIAAAVERATDSPLGLDILCESVNACVAQRLQLLIPRVFVVEFHRAREMWGQPVDADSTKAIDRYVAEFDTSTVERWFETYPVLAELVDTVVAGSVAHVGEIADRWHSDRVDLEERGFVPPSAVPVGIEHLGSDAHQGGRMVAALRLGDGSRLIYKPRSLGPEQYTKFCLEIMSGDLDLDVGGCAPDSLDRVGYGWQREVVPHRAELDVDVDHYYARLGMACALLGALGATDMHHENVIAAGDHPVMLDLETVMHATQALTAQDLAGAVINRIKTSLANTLLLPQRLPSGPYSVLLGGIGVPHEQQSSRTEYVMVNRDTDAVDIARRTYPFVHRDNILRGPDGHPTDLLDHRRAFLDGLRQGTEAVMANREAFVRRLDEHPVEVRQIFRSTAVYGRVLDAATHPDNLRRQEDFRRIVTMLRPPPGLERRIVQSFVAEAEHAALERGDVPYFVIPSNDVRARSEGLVSPPIADLSPRDRAVHGLRQTSERTFGFDALLVEEGLAELRTARRQHEPTYRASARGAWGAAFLRADGFDAHAILEHLDRVSVPVEGVDGPERGWVCGAFGPSLATFDPGSSVSFHDAGGMLLPFERAALDGDSEARSRAAEVRRGLTGLARVYRERLEGLAWSAASGLISVDYVLGHGAARLRLTSRDEGSLLDPERCPPDDTMKGLPGASLLLAGFPETPTELVTLLGARLPQDTSSTPWDLAHGGLGLMWARHRVSTILGDRDAAQEVAEAFDSLVAGMPDVLPGAWCAGAASACMIAAEIPCTEAAVRSAARQATTLPDTGAPVDLSVCHGASGVVQALVRFGQSSGARWALELAADYWSRVAARASTEGYVTGDPSRQGLLGYFLGWSGVADTALLLDQALRGEQVWVPLSFTSSVVAAQGATT